MARAAVLMSLFLLSYVQAETAQLESLKLVVKLLRPILDDIQTTVGNVEETVSNLESTVSNLVSRQNDNDAKLDLLDTKQDELNMKVMSVSSELEHNVSIEVKKTYDLLDQHSNTFTCDGEKGWRRVVYLNMRDPNMDCPDGWEMTSYFQSACGRTVASTDKFKSCDSVFFPVTDGAYTRVCGAIRAYQYGFTQGFLVYNRGIAQANNTDGPYVDGVSLTHGSPRQHIWTFAAGFSEDQSNFPNRCPCYVNATIDTPPFVGGDYFCESGRNSSHYSPDLAVADPLWDGEGCTSTSRCCEYNNPPYFTKQLSSPTTDDIEARICRWSTHSDNPVEFIELYVK